MKCSRIDHKITVFKAKSDFARNLEYVLAHKTDSKAKTLLNLDFREVFKKHYHKDYFLGAGCFNKTYKLDDEYVMRVPSFKEAIPGKFTCKNYDRGLSNVLQLLKTYYGRVIAKFGEIQILKNAAGNEINNVIANKKSNSDYNTRLKYFLNEHLPAFASLEQSAYDNLAEDITRLNRTNYSFDFFNSNNFMIANKEIRVVDDLEKTTAESYLLHLMKPFCSTNINPDDFTEEGVKNLRIIIKKCMTAAKKTGLPWNPESAPSSYADILHNADINCPMNVIYKKTRYITDIDDFKNKLDQIF